MGDFSATVFLPKANLPMRSQTKIEESLLAGWDGLYAEVAEINEGGTPFVLHDGPPYANGNIHIGHALNKILKDLVVRTRMMLGQHASFTPGWDCHGLPIEWKVEEEWRAAGREKNAEPEAFVQDCRAYAAKWVAVQREQFRRLGIMADWEHPYLTMDPATEAKIVSEFHNLVKAGKVYRANKAVLWSPAEKTALAEAETVEQEHVVPNVWVTFDLVSGPLRGQASLLVWTTTPWSLPGNVGVAYNSKLSYGLYRSEDRTLVVADVLAEEALKSGYERIGDVSVRDLEDCHARSPLGEDFKVAHLIEADFVRDNAGTGFVHVGPAHSNEDWIAWHRFTNGDPFPNPVGPNGVYNEDVPVFARVPVTKGKRMGPANETVVAHMADRGTLYRVEDRPLTLQHSWRSDAVLITRATPQVFIDLHDAKKKAVEALSTVAFTPESSRQRIVSMIENRPDWLVSRQRLWGSPVALFAHRETGEILADPRVLDMVSSMIAELGSESWLKLDQEVLFAAAGRTDSDAYDRVDDVLDVWFDSACVHAFMPSPVADLVIEGSDQSRGWFQSSLMEAVLSGREAPYRAVLTHGFVLDGNGIKMAKSKKNVIDPADVIKEYGADTLRVWVASTDATEDLRVSKDAMKTHAETARKLRNTLRYMVGALKDFDGLSSFVPLPELERYVLHRVHETSIALQLLLRDNSFPRYMATLVNFAVEVSSTFFDVRKDTLYCDPKSDPKRQAYLFALNYVFNNMVRWVAPIMVFTADEAWQEYGVSGSSVHKQRWMRTADFANPELAEKWHRLLTVRGIVLAAVERARTGGEVKAAADADVTLMVKETSQEFRDLVGFDMAELAIAASVKVVGVADFADPGMIADASVDKTTAQKCDRCWQHREVVENDDSKLCQRCRAVVGG